MLHILLSGCGCSTPDIQAYKGVLERQSVHLSERGHQFQLTNPRPRMQVLVDILTTPRRCMMGIIGGREPAFPIPRSPLICPNVDPRNPLHDPRTLPRDHPHEVHVRNDWRLRRGRITEVLLLLEKTVTLLNARVDDLS